MPRSFEDTIRRLEKRLLHPLPGPAAQLRMAPERRDAEERIQVRGRNCREAGVLVLIVPENGLPHVVLTVRHLHLPDHPGQVSFPGGRREDGESLMHTALREAHEEVDVSVSAVEMLGPLTPLYIPPSNYCVFPYLGFARTNLVLTPHDLEVERIVRVPLPGLLEETARREEIRTIRGQRVLVPYFEVSGLQVWGATAMMLSEVVALLDD